MAELVRDVVLHENSGDLYDPRLVAEPPITARFDVGPGLYIERLPGPLNRDVKSACAFRGHHWHIEMDTYPTFYAFVRETADEGNWDQAQDLQTAVALSRICHPTSIGLEFAGRVYEPGVRHATEHAVMPALVAGHGNQAFIPDPTARNWLVAGDVPSLPILIGNLTVAPERVRRAAWFHEYAARTEHVPVRLTLVAAGVEALTHVERRFSTRQFVVGAAGLAADAGLIFSEADAADAYEKRSTYAHGMSVKAAPAPVLINLEAVLRGAIKKALLEPATYGQTFVNDAAIRARFPL